MPETVQSAASDISRTNSSVGGATNEPFRQELLEGCRRGNLKQVKQVLTRGMLNPELKSEALKTAAEYGHAPVFEEVLLEHGHPDEETLRHAVRWALRYHDRRILGAIMQADTGTFTLTQEDLQQLRALEARHPKPDRIVLYLIDRTLARERR